MGGADQGLELRLGLSGREDKGARAVPPGAHSTRRHTRVLHPREGALQRPPARNWSEGPAAGGTARSLRGEQAGEGAEEAGQRRDGGGTAGLCIVIVTTLTHMVEGRTISPELPRAFAGNGGGAFFVSGCNCGGTHIGRAFGGRGRLLGRALLSPVGAAWLEALRGGGKALWTRRRGFDRDLRVPAGGQLPSRESQTEFSNQYFELGAQDWGKGSRQDIIGV